MLKPPTPLNQNDDQQWQRVLGASCKPLMDNPHHRAIPPAEILLSAVAALTGREGVTQLNYRRERNPHTGETMLTVNLVVAAPEPTEDSLKDFDKLREAM